MLGIPTRLPLRIFIVTTSMQLLFVLMDAPREPPPATVWPSSVGTGHMPSASLALIWLGSADPTNGSCLCISHERGGIASLPELLQSANRLCQLAIGHRELHSHRRTRRDIEKPKAYSVSYWRRRRKKAALLRRVQARRHQAATCPEQWRR